LAYVIIAHHIPGLYGVWLDADRSNHGLFLDIISTFLGGGRRIMNSHDQDSQFTGFGSTFVNMTEESHHYAEMFDSHSLARY
jgi:hypothetical protein